jgi:hypothetical protein
MKLFIFPRINLPIYSKVNSADKIYLVAEHMKVKQQKAHN